MGFNAGPGDKMMIEFCFYRVIQQLTALLSYIYRFMPHVRYLAGDREKMLVINEKPQKKEGILEKPENNSNIRLGFFYLKTRFAKGFSACWKHYRTF
jgi:hypothetical protein